MLATMSRKQCKLPVPAAPMLSWCTHSTTSPVQPQCMQHEKNWPRASVTAIKNKKTEMSRTNVKKKWWQQPLCSGHWVTLTFAITEVLNCSFTLHFGSKTKVNPKSKVTPKFRLLLKPCLKPKLRPNFSFKPNLIWTIQFYTKLVQCTCHLDRQFWSNSNSNFERDLKKRNGIVAGRWRWQHKSELDWTVISGLCPMLHSKWQCHFYSHFL